MSSPRPVVYPRLAARIAELDRTHAEVAVAVGIHPGTLTQVLRGRLHPSEDLRSRLADVLASTVDELFAEPGVTDDVLDAARELVARTRAAQGLPPTVDDPDALRRIAVIAAAAGRSTARIAS